MTEQKAGQLTRNQRLAFLAILLAAILSRTVLLGRVPGGLHQDEAMAGYNALSLLRYGKDSFGNPWPVYFTAWGSGMNVLESWLQIPFFLLLGPCELAVRLPMAVFSLLSLLALFDLARRFGDNRFALFVFFLASVMPWHVMASRWALESNLAPLFILFGLWAFVRGLERPSWLPLSGLCYGLSLYAYATLWPVVPLMLALQCLYGIRLKKLRLSGWSALALAVLGLLALPLILFLLVNNGLMEEIRLPFLTIPRMVAYRGNEILSESVFKNLNQAAHVLALGDAFPWHSIAGFGLYYLVSLPFIPIGVIVGGRRAWKAWKFRENNLDFYMLVIALAGFVLGCLIQVDAKRINVIHFSMTYFAARGIWMLVGKTTPRALAAAAAVYVLIFGFFEFRYFGDFRVQVSGLFREGCGEALTFVKNNLADCKKVYLDLYWSPIGLPYSKAYFYLEEDVNTLTETIVFANDPDPFLEVVSFDRYVLKFEYENAADLSAAYMLETEADHSPLVRDLMKNGYAVRDFGSYRVYYRESGVS